MQQIVVTGNVIEDWEMSGLSRGQCLVSLPEGGPFYFAAEKYQERGPQ